MEFLANHTFSLPFFPVKPCSQDTCPWISERNFKTWFGSKEAPPMASIIMFRSNSLIFVSNLKALEPTDFQGFRFQARWVFFFNGPDFLVAQNQYRTGVVSPCNKRSEIWQLQKITIGNRDPRLFHHLLFFFVFLRHHLWIYLWKFIYITITVVGWKCHEQ